MSRFPKVVVVGQGIAGTAAAWRAAELGATVTVVAAGAGATAGFDGAKDTALAASAEHQHRSVGRDPSGDLGCRTGDVEDREGQALGHVRGHPRVRPAREKNRLAGYVELGARRPNGRDAVDAERRQRKRHERRHAIAGRQVSVGAAGAGGQAQSIWGSEALTVVSVIMTLLILIVATRYLWPADAALAVKVVVIANSASKAAPKHHVSRHGL